MTDQEQKRHHLTRHVWKRNGATQRERERFCVYNVIQLVDFFEFMTISLLFPRFMSNHQALNFKLELRVGHALALVER